MNVDQRAKGHLPRNGENSPGDDAMWNVRRRNSVDVGANNRRSEGYQQVGKAVLVLARATPDVRGFEFVALPQMEME